MYRPSLRHGIIVGLRTACLAMLLNSAFRADEPKKEPTVVEQGQARIADIKRRLNALSARRTAVEAKIDALDIDAPNLSRKQFEERIAPILRERAEIDRQRADIAWDIATMQKWMKENGLLKADPPPEKKASTPKQT
jgi:cell division protein FtsB